MNAKSLLNFIQGKYDRVTDKNEKMLDDMDTSNIEKALFIKQFN